MFDSPEDLAYAEALRAIQSQEARLAELRSRTGLLPTGASIATSLLGARALDGEPLDALVGIGLLAFVAVVGCCIRVALPQRDVWRFSFGATTLLEDWVDEPRSGDVLAMKRFLAEKHEENLEKNQNRLDDLYNWFTAAAALLGIEVVVLALSLT